jgi:RNA polymerase sigma factor (sigma-70 family)
MTEAEFREAYESNKDRLYRFSCRMTGSAEAAEDLVHDCFLMLWRRTVVWDRTRGPLRNFMFGVVRNLALKRIAQERTFDELADDSAVCGPIDPANRERGDIVAQAVSALPPLQREALVLAEYEEMPLQGNRGVDGRGSGGGQVAAASRPREFATDAGSAAAVEGEFPWNTMTIEN